MGVKELLNRIDSRELTEWQAYLYLEQEDQKAAEKSAEVKSAVRRR